MLSNVLDSALRARHFWRSLVTYGKYAPSSYAEIISTKEEEHLLNGLRTQISQIQEDVKPPVYWETMFLDHQIVLCFNQPEFFLFLQPDTLSLSLLPLDDPPPSPTSQALLLCAVQDIRVMRAALDGS